MSASSEDLAAKDGSRRQPWVAKVLWPRLMELWILAVLVMFLVIRVLGSQTAQRLLGGLHHSRLS